MKLSRGKPQAYQPLFGGRAVHFKVSKEVVVSEKMLALKLPQFTDFMKQAEVTPPPKQPKAEDTSGNI